MTNVLPALHYGHRENVVSTLIAPALAFNEGPAVSGSPVTMDLLCRLVIKKDIPIAALVVNHLPQPPRCNFSSRNICDLLESDHPQAPAV